MSESVRVWEGGTEAPLRGRPRKPLSLLQQVKEKMWECHVCLWRIRWSDTTPTPGHTKKGRAVELLYEHIRIEHPSRAGRMA